MSIIQGTSKAAGGAGYTIDQSIRFNKDDDAKLTRTFGTATNRKIYTLSVWEKNGSSAGSLLEYNATGGVTWANITFGQDGRIDFFDYSGGSARIDLRTSAIYRDPSAWYHVVVAVDTTQATSTDRIKMYVNGVQITSFGTATYPSQNFEGFLNSSVLHLIGDGVNGPFDGYLGEYHFIDGQALDPTNFGETNADGVWVPIEYTGSYGTNGFYITGATASDLGEDFSGNNNDFTSSGLATTDQMLDTPTDNFCTLSPIDGYGGKLTLSDGNLRAVPSAGTYCNNHGTFYVGSGKWVYECKLTTVFGEAVGWSPLGEQISGSSHRGWLMFNDGRAYINTTNQGTLGTSLSSGDYRYIFYDADNQAMWFAHCDVSSGTPTTLVYENGATKSEIETGDTTNAVFTSISAVDLAPGLWMDTSGVIETNFGQSAFYTNSDLPTGFNTLSTASLPDPTIADPSAHFNSVLFTGNSGTAFSVTGVGFQPDFVWGKPRSYTDNHRVMDVVRGSTKQLITNTTSAEFTQAQGITSFDSDGFTVGTHNGLNTGTNTYVAWCWLADNTTGSSNTDGSINTTATSVNTMAGFSISTYTGTGSNATVGHGLGIAPKMVIVKRRNSTSSWRVYHAGLTSAAYVLNMESTDAQGVVATVWNSTDPTSSVFSIGTNAEVNTSGGTYVAYCFAEVEGFSKFGSYTGNGSTDGPFVYTGMTPELVIIKRTNTTENWIMLDNARSEYNVTDDVLYPNLSQAENVNSTTTRVDNVSNGFKVRGTNTNINASGSTYIYMAVAESPFKTATAR